MITFLSTAVLAARAFVSLSVFGSRVASLDFWNQAPGRLSNILYDMSMKMMVRDNFVHGDLHGGLLGAALNL